MTVTYANSKVVGFSLYMDFKTKDGFLIKASNSEKMLDLRNKNSVELADLLSKKRKIKIWKLNLKIGMVIIQM